MENPSLLLHPLQSCGTPLPGTRSHQMQDKDKPWSSSGGRGFVMKNLVQPTPETRAPLPLLGKRRDNSSEQRHRAASGSRAVAGYGQCPSQASGGVSRSPGPYRVSDGGVSRSRAARETRPSPPPSPSRKAWLSSPSGYLAFRAARSNWSNRFSYS